MSRQFTFVILGLFLAVQLVLAAPGGDDIVGGIDETGHDDGSLEYYGEDAGDEVSQLALVPSDDQEIENLGEYQELGEFCIRARDHMMKTMKQGTNNALAKAYQMLFKSAEEVAMEVIATQRMATDRLGDQLERPDTPVEEKETTSEAAKVIVNQQKIIKEEQDTPKSLLGSILAALRATGLALVQAVSQKISDQKENFNWVAFFGTLESACDQLSSLENDLKDKFKETIQKIAVKSPAYAELKYSKVPCVSTSRLNYLEGMCSGVRFTSGTVVAMIQNQRAMNQIAASEAAYEAEQQKQKPESESTQ